MVPITFLLADALDVDPVPLIVIEIVASNIGGTATLIGDPPNILIAGHTGLSFGAFIANLAPIVLVSLVIIIPGLYLAFRSRLQIEPKARERVMSLDAAKSIEDAAEAKRTVPILILAILVFFIHKPLHIEPATVALAGAAVMLMVSRQSLHDSIASIEWLTLFFLIGLFVMVGALEETGALEEVATGIANATGGDRVAELLGIMWVCAIGSGLVDNIPFTAAMIPVVDTLAEDDAYWWALVARRLLRRQRHHRRRRLQRRRLGHVGQGRQPDRLRLLPALRHPRHPRLPHPRHRLRAAEVHMSPRTITELALREPPILRTVDTIENAVGQLLAHQLPALPVLDGRGRFAGIFGEREFMSALFPGYLDQLKGAAFLRRSLDETLEKRDACRHEPIERLHQHRARRRRPRLLRHPSRRDLPAPPRPHRPRHRQRSREGHHHPHRLLPRHRRTVPRCLALPGSTSRPGRPPLPPRPAGA